MKILSSKLHTKLPTWVIRLIKVGLFVTLCIVLIQLFHKKVSVAKLWETLSNMGTTAVAGCIVVVFLMPVNWGLEALKWKLLLRNIQQLSFTTAFGAVLSGAALGNLSPLMVGDFLGRLRSLHTKNRVVGGSALLFGNGIQTYVLLLLGLGGWSILHGRLPDITHFWSIVGFLTVLILVGSMFFFRVFEFSCASNYPILKAVNAYETYEVALLIAIGLVRQCVFSLQYVVLLLIFGVPLPFYQLFAVVSVILLFKTIGLVAGIWGDLVFRQVSAVYFFGLLAVPPEPVMVASMLLWLINIFVPMLGGIFVLMFPNNRERLLNNDATL